MARKGYTQRKLAKEIGISENTLSAKIKHGSFGTEEVQMIMRILDIKDPTPIFFGSE